MSDLLNKASLVMVPSGYKEDTVYSVVPSDGSGDLAFTRASNGTRINSAGLVEVCPWNLMSYSEEFNNASWSKSNTTVTANAITAPNGTTTADFIVANTSNDLHSIFQSSGITNGKYTISVYAKQGGYKNLLVWFDGHSGGIGVNLDNLTIFRNQNNDGYLIETLANGWYKISVTATISIASLPNFYIYDNSATPQISFAGNGTSGIYLWGAQMNTGTLKPYFPTTDRLNVPRLTYQNGGGGCPSLLLEKQSTNLITYSEDFTNAIYITGGGGGGSITRTANYAISPDGTQNADRLQIVRGSSYVELYQRVAVTIGTTYTFSFWAKSLSGTPTLYTTWNGAYSNEVTFTTDWVRYTDTFVAADTTAGFNFATWTGLPSTSTTADLLVWGAQLEASSYPTSYIPTTSSSATRVVDQSTTTLGSSIIGQSEGVFFVDVDFSPYLTGVYNNPQTILIRNGTSYANYIYIASHGTNGQLVASMVASGLFIYLTSTQTLPNRFKCALAYKSGDTVFYINGNLAGTSTTTFSPLTLNDLRLNHDEGSLKINEIALFKTRLTNAELASLTTL